MNERPTVLVTAPSRLHFGLLSFGNPETRQFGGVGAMIDRPGLKLRVAMANRLEIRGLLPDRVREAALQWRASSRDVDELRCNIELISAPRLHAGLGVGTQLALAVATGLNAFHNLATPSAEELARSVGRGLRSAVGTYGFMAGGLIAEQGKLPVETVSPILERVPLPGEWRFVLVSPTSGVGLHGSQEQAAFDELPPVPADVTRQLSQIMRERILPAAKSARFAEFSAAIYDFGFLAGSCFEAVQGSAYNGAELESLVRQIRSLGVRGVGQSSWGPTIYAICESESSELTLVEQLRLRSGDREYDLVVAKPDNYGARVVTADL